MPAPLRQILGNAAIYSAGTLLVQLASFLLLPLYTRVLGPDDYGILSLLWVVQTILVLFGELALTSATFRYYHDQPDSFSKDKLLSSSFWLIAAMTTLLFLVITLGAPVIAPALFDFDDATGLLRLLAATAWLTPMSTLLLRTFQLWQKPYGYVLLSIAQFGITMVTTLILVLHADFGVRGVLIGQLCGVAAISAIGIGVLFSRLGHGIRRSDAARLLRFSIPLVPTGFAALVIALSDRFFLEYFSSLTEVGLYAVADKMTAALSVLVVTPLLLSWNQFAFANHSSSEFIPIFRRALRLVPLVLGLGILVYSMVIRELLSIATTAEFVPAWTTVPILCSAPAAHALITLLATGIHLKQQTRWIPLLYGIGMVANLALNALLVPPWGMVGAAWATLLGMGITTAGFYLTASRVYPIEYPLKSILQTVGITALCVVLFVWMTQAVAPTWAQWLLRIPILALFAFAAWRLDLIDRQDWQTIIARVIRQRAKTR